MFICVTLSVQFLPQGSPNTSRTFTLHWTLNVNDLVLQSKCADRDKFPFYSTSPQMMPPSEGKTQLTPWSNERPLLCHGCQGPCWRQCAFLDIITKWTRCPVSIGTPWTSENSICLCEISFQFPNYRKHPQTHNMIIGMDASSNMDTRANKGYFCLPPLNITHGNVI